MALAFAIGIIEEVIMLLILLVVLDDKYCWGYNQQNEIKNDAPIPAAIA